MPKVLNNNLYSTSGNSKGKDKAAKIVKLFLLITAHPPKEVLEKSKFFSKRMKTTAKNKMITKQSYTQVANPKVSDILKLKEDYLSLPAKKIKNIHRIINNTDKTKLHIKMTTKRPS